LLAFSFKYEILDFNDIFILNYFIYIDPKSFFIKNNKYNKK
jgi:hypothetical protein